MWWIFLIVLIETMLYIWWKLLFAHWSVYDRKNKNGGKRHDHVIRDHDLH